MAPARDLPDAIRWNGVIAMAWDVTFTFFGAKPWPADVVRPSAHVSLQEAGRTSPRDEAPAQVRAQPGPAPGTVARPCAVPADAVREAAAWRSGAPVQVPARHEVRGGLARVEGAPGGWDRN